MNKSPRILIAEGLPALNKGALELIEGTLKTFDILGRTEVDMFSFYPEIDRERYSQRIGLIDICKDLHLERFMPGGSPGARVPASVNAELLSTFLAGIQHLSFVLLYKLFGKNVLCVMREPIWNKYCSSDIFVACLNETDCVNGNYIGLSPVYISLLAKTLGKLAIVYANSNMQVNDAVWIWRFPSRWLWKVLARYFLNNMNLITTRDKDTLKLYGRLARSNIPLYFTGDVGVLMEPAHPSAVKEIMAQEKINKNDRLLFGVSITKRLLSHSFTEISDSNERYEKGIREIASIFDKLILECRATIIFVPHCIEYTRNVDDRDVGNDILKKMKNKEYFKVITKEYTPQELKGVMGQLDILIGDRIHALISALSMNVPCIALAHQSDRRHYNLIGKDFEQERWVFEVDAFEANALFRLLTELISASVEIRESLPLITQRARERALRNGQLLKALLNTDTKTSKTA
jgi:polysaccharide pyruvyl transferase WcaK-like protein